MTDSKEKRKHQSREVLIQSCHQLIKRLQTSPAISLMYTPGRTDDGQLKITLKSLRF